MGFYDGNVIVFGRGEGHTMRAQVNDTAHPEWEAVIDDDVNRLASVHTGEPVAVQISDPDDDRNGWSAQAHWDRGTERPILRGDARFTAP